MFRHLMKGLPWQLGPLPLLLLLLIIVRVNTSAGKDAIDAAKGTEKLAQTDVKAAAKATSTEVNSNTPSNDYDADEDETAAPAEQNQPKGPKPVFEKPMQTLYLGSSEKTQINCSAKNFNDLKHSVLWYKDNQIIANGNHSMTNEYQVDAKMNLVIEHITKNTPGSYVCQINPGKINQTTILKTGEDPEIKKNGSGQKDLPIFTLIALSSMYLAQLFDI